MKGRYWAVIGYPESLKENWENELEETGLQFCVSPLHDKDINPTGEKKKEHYHILIEFAGPTTYKYVKENISDKILATIPKKIESLRGYYRYLTHMDNPEKAQYEIKDIKEYNGFKLDLTTTEVNRIKQEIISDIEENKIKEYCDLIDLYLITGDYDKWDVATSNTFFFDKYICSKRNKMKQIEEKVLKKIKK